MGGVNGEDVVRAHVLACGGSPRLPPPTDGSTGWRGVIVGPGTERAPVRAETTRFLKARAIPGREIHAVAYEDDDGVAWSWVHQVRQLADGSWHLAGGGGGAGSPVVRDVLRVDLFGVAGHDGVALGGRVTGPRAGEVAVVELGPLADTVEDGLVLLLSAEPVPGLQGVARLLADDGTVLAEHPVP
jgi:hypothetical protein